MDYFRYVIKCILRKIPLKLLLIIFIVLFLTIICFNAKSYAADIPTYEVSGTNYSLCPCIPNSTCWDIFTSYTEYQSGLYHWVINTRNGWTAMAFWLKSYDVKFYNNGTPTTRFAVLDGGNISQMPCQVYYWKDDGSRQGSTFTNWDVNSNAYSVGDTIYYLTDVPVYTDNTFNTIWWGGLEEPYTAPYIVNSTGLTNWSFDNLYISLGSENYRYTEDGIGYEPTWWTLDFEYNEEVYTIRLDDYIYTQEGIDEVIFRVPRNILTNYVVLRSGANVKFGLTQYNIHLGQTRFKTFLLDTWTLNLTAQEQQDINDDSQKQIMGSIDSGISNLNDNISGFYSSFSNTNVSDGLVNDFFDSGDTFLVSDQSGIDNFFNILYNAFCTNNVVNVSFTIPFTNKTMTISSASVSNFYPQALKNIMSIVSYGAISLFICRDIRKMVDKSLEGSPENISHDIKREVL